MKHYHKNPRQITKKQKEDLFRWMDEFGDLGCIVVNIRTDEELIGGNQRSDYPGIMSGLIQPVIEKRFDPPTPQGTVMEGYYEIKGESFKIRWVDWDDKKAERANLIANKAGGTFDMDILANQFDLPVLLDSGFEERELIGFDFGEPKDAEPQIEADRFEEVAKKWQTADNQLWKIGSHYVYCGDSLNVESIEKVLQGQEPSLVIADPPYGVSIVAANGYVGGESAKGMIPFGGRKGNVGGGASHIAKTGMTYMESNRIKRFRGTDGASKPFGSKAERGSVGAAHIVEVGKYPVIIGDESTETAKKAVALYLERFDNAYHVWWGANYYIESLTPSPCWLVWNKETTGNFADCELAWSNADMSAKLFTHQWNGMLRDSEREKRWHPTQKPAALAEWCMGLFTEKDDVIIDPFGGAGWSLIGAQNSNRKACVIEKSPEYLAVQLERMTTAFPDLLIQRIPNDAQD